MTPASPKLPAELLALAEKHLAGTLTAAERNRFETLLREHPGAADYCATLAFTEALLPEAADRLEQREAAAARAPLRFPGRRLALAAAACLALGLAGGVLGPRLFPDHPTGRVAHAGVPARITQALGVRWTAGATAVGERPGSPAGAFDAGLLELTLDSGVRLLLEGPAEYRVTGVNSCRLLRGKAVVDVPVPAQGFILESARERIIDHGTRFAVNMGNDGRIGTLGVLSGIVDIEKKPGDTLRLFTDYAVARRGDAFDSTPFYKDGFCREMPAREFPWRLTTAPGAPAPTLEFDVSALIRGPGDFRMVLKWLTGRPALELHRVSLRRDDTLVDTRSMNGVVGDHTRARDNFAALRIPPGTPADGRWRLVAELTPSADAHAPADETEVRGVMHFAEGLSLAATDRDFRGVWRYTHDGVDWTRECLPDGRVRMTMDGADYGGAHGARWRVADGLLLITFATGNTESHMLQEDGALVFLNRNYRNAHKSESRR